MEILTIFDTHTDTVALLPKIKILAPAQNTLKITFWFGMKYFCQFRHNAVN